MVGRFVEKKDIRLSDEDLGQVQSRPLPAGQFFDVGFPHLTREADAEQGAFELVLPRISAVCLEFVLQFFIFLQGPVEIVIGMLGHGVLKLSHAMCQFVQMRKSQLGFVDDCVGRVKARLLREMADLQPPVDRHHARLRLHLPCDDFEKSGFSRAIIADQPDALAAVEQQVGLIENNAIAERLFEILEGEERHVLLLDIAILRRSSSLRRKLSFRGSL